MTELLQKGRETLAIDSAMFMPSAHVARLTAAVVVSQSGRSTEAVQAMEALTIPRLALTNDDDSPLAHLCEAVVPLGFLEDSPIYTLGYTGTLQALGLTVSALFGEPPDLGWDSLPDQVESTLENAREPIQSLARTVRNIRCVDFVGGGSHAAAAMEGALLLREAARIPTSVYSLHQYLHGPVESVGEGVLVVIIGGSRERELAIEVARTGADVLVVTTFEVDSLPTLQTVRLPTLPPLLEATLEVLPLQLLAADLATLQGIKVEGLRRLQRDTKIGCEPSLAVKRRRPGAIGIDLGGTKLSIAAVSDRSGDTVYFETVSTPKEPMQMRQAVFTLLERARVAASRSAVEIEGVGLAVPEVVGLDGRILSHTVVPGLDSGAWFRDVMKVCPAVIESDVRAAARAEALCGKGVSYASFCYLSIGTGISYSFVKDGVVHAGARGAAIHLGSAVTAEWGTGIDRQAWVLEKRASGPALLLRYRDLGGTAETTEKILQLYGFEKAATQALKEVAHDLGLGISLVVNLLDPDAIVLGGGLGTAGPPFFQLVDTATRAYIWTDAARDLPIVEAALGPRSAVIGAAFAGWDNALGRAGPSRPTKLRVW